MQSAQRCRRRELCASTGDFEDVGFVFANFLYFLAGVNSANDQRGLCRLRGLSAQEQRGLTRKLSEETLRAAFEARFRVPGQRDGKGGIDLQASSAGLDASGHGHEIHKELLRRS